MGAPPRVIDRRLIVRRRDRAAAGAEAHDFLLRRVADDFAERLEIMRRSFPVAVNLGAYHGALSRRIRAVGSVGLVIDVERSPRMLALCDGPSVLADDEALPFAGGSLDLVVSGLSLQFVNDLPGTLVQIRRALKPDGLFLGALIGGVTLNELREAWLHAEIEVRGGASPRILPFSDVRDMGALLQRAGFALPVVDSDVVKVTYPSLLALAVELRGMGASNALSDRSRVPVTRNVFARAAEIYAERFAEGERVAATFEILTLTAWVPHESQQKPLQPGSAEVRLADALGAKEQKLKDRE